MSDLISRQAAIEAIEEYADRLQMVDWKENPGVTYKAYALNWCINTIRDLPSADIDLSDYSDRLWRNAYEQGKADAEAERRMGKWVYNSPVTVKCDQCGHVIADWDWNESNFCPHCGADMRGEDDDTD